MVEEAIRKIAEGKAEAAKTSREAGVMAGAVADKLADFCRQDKGFAQAVVRGGSFADCMRSVAKGVGRSISDLEAYRRAVKFYFQGAEVRMTLTIDLDGRLEEPGGQGQGIVLDLTDFF